MTDLNLTTIEVVDLDVAMRGWARDLNLDTETVPEVIARIVAARQSEAPTTLWLVVAQRQSMEDYRDWAEEEAWQTIERGYFLSEADARGWIERTEEAKLVKARAEHAEQERMGRHRLTQDEARRKTRIRTQQREYDALKDAGLKPSFKRPVDFVEKTFKPTTFDEKLWLRHQDIRYLVEKIEPCEEGS